jgi:hypothetical protein
MSKEFEKLEVLLDMSGRSERDPQVDRDEAAKLAARWGWLVRRASRATGGPIEAPKRSDALGREQTMARIRTRYLSDDPQRSAGA